MTLAAKLNLKPGMKICVLAKPPEVALKGVPTTAAASSEAVLVFVKRLAEVDAKCGPAVAAAKEDGLAWIAYPKAGQLGTDLNRDVLWRHLLKQGIQGIRLVALDGRWSAMRFRPRAGRT